ncbi:hypothetical protein [Tenacibaculum xiamenense]|uniref:hypothetical protein n=1 Tax=Tenacibaculum xiamenense TaxID=1261553 RepID=UPI0038946559
MKLKNITLLIVFILIVSSRVNAQNFEVFVDFEGGIPISNSLKNFHQDLADQIPLENFKTSDNFAFNYGFRVGIRINKKASIFYGRRVSGAKSSIADFSGFIRLTNELTGSIFGLEYEFPIKEFEKANLNLGIKGLVTPSTLILETESRGGIGNQNDKLEFNSLDFGGAIALNYEYSVGYIVLRAHLDLNVYIGGKLTLENDDSGAYLTTPSGGRLTTGWSGITGGIGLVVPF